MSKANQRKTDRLKKRGKEIDRGKNVETLVSHLAEDRQRWQGSVVPPIYQNSLFTFPDLEAVDAAFSNPVESLIYTRGRNPSVTVAEAKIAGLCKGEKAKLFASGMAAISSAILRFVQTGDHILTIKNLYGPTNHFINHYLGKKFGIMSSFVSGRNPEEFREEIRDNTGLIYLESPSSVVYSLQDIRRVTRIAQEFGIPTVMDNTWATPLFQKPMEMGVDLEVHSVSKYLGGHSDLVAGVVVGRSDLIDQIYLKEHALLGGKVAPFEGWLLTRSLRTFPMRMHTHQENALQVAAFLEEHPRVAKVFYPGLKSHPQYRLGCEQLAGYSGLMSFSLDTDSVETVTRFVNHLQLFQIGVSWGGHESLVFTPGLALNKELPPDQFREMGISPTLVRISVGLENPLDQISDLKTALESI